jgi:hypothetical protein
LRKHIPTAAQSFGNEDRTLDDEQPLLNTSGSTRKQAPQLLNALV